MPLLSLLSFFAPPCHFFEALPFGDNIRATLRADGYADTDAMFDDAARNAVDECLLFALLMTTLLLTRAMRAPPTDDTRARRTVARMFAQVTLRAAIRAHAEDLFGSVLRAQTRRVDATMRWRS